jgi:hypothetical protein
VSHHEPPRVFRVVVVGDDGWVTTIDGESQLDGITLTPRTLTIDFTRAELSTERGDAPA